MYCLFFLKSLLVDCSLLDTSDSGVGARIPLAKVFFFGFEGEKKDSMFRFRQGLAVFAVGFDS